MMEGKKAASGLLRYYENRLGESPDDIAWQIGYEISQKLVALIESSETKTEDAEVLLSYAHSQDKSIEHPMWLDLVYIVSDYRMFMSGKNATLFA
jgi:hypothetical protein